MFVKIFKIFLITVNKTWRNTEKISIIFLNKKQRKKCMSVCILLKTYISMNRLDMSVHMQKLCKFAVAKLLFQDRDEYWHNIRQF